MKATSPDAAQPRLGNDAGKVAATSAAVVPSPADHVRMLADLLQPAMPDLARRWLSALLLVPPHDRPHVVASVERRVVELYSPDQAASRTPGDSAAPSPAPTTLPSGRLIEVIHPPAQREGYVEQVVTTYEDVRGASGTAPDSGATPVPHSRITPAKPANPPPGARTTSSG